MKSKKNSYVINGLRALVATVFASIFLTNACTKNVDYSKLSSEETYTIAEAEFAKENYVTAAEAYTSIDKNYPYSSLATTSLLKAALTYYKDGKFIESLDMVYKFLSINPNSPDVPYAYYLQSRCYLEQMSDYRRDQSAATDALNSIEYLQKNYPDNAYTKELLPQIRVLKNQFAAKILQTGKEELRINNFSAAINNFQAVVKKYPESDMVPEALYRLVESYTSSDLPDMRAKIINKMRADYPENVWTSRAIALTNNYIDIDADISSDISENQPEQN